MRWPSALEWALGAVAVVCLLIAAWSFDPFGRRKHAETVAKSAVTQSAVDTATTKAVDHYIERRTIIREKADHAVQSVQQAPGAQTPIADDRRAVLCAALAGVRDGPVCTDSDGSKDPPGALPGADLSHENPG